jgi:hypothetical protein
MSTIKVEKIQHPNAVSASITLDSSGNLAFPAGSASTPAIQGPGDSNTGLFFPAADTIAFAEGGTEALRIDSSGRVGIGTSSPTTTFDVNGNTRISGGGIRALGYYSDSSSAYNVSIGMTGNVGYLQAINVGNASELSIDGSPIKFRTGSFTEAVRIDASGRVGIGTTSPAQLLHIQGASNPCFISIDTRNSVNAYFYAGQSESNFGSASNHPLKFNVNDTEKARIDTSGRFLVGTSTSTSVSVAVFQGNSSSSTGAGVIHISRGSTANASGDGCGVIRFSDNSQNIRAEIEGSSDGTGGTNDYPGRLTFSTTADGASSPTERMRIGQNGYTKISDAASYNNLSGTYHEFNNSAADWTTYFRNASANPSGLIVRYAGAAPNGTSNQFLYCFDTSALRAEIRSNGGLANYSANNVNLSDRNVKKDISPATGTWDCLKEWEIVNFRYKDQPDDAGLNMGVIAQQVAESCPEVITVFQEATEDQPEKLGVKDQQMMWMAIKALQEAQLRIETLEAEVAALKGA